MNIFPRNCKSKELHHHCIFLDNVTTRLDMSDPTAESRDVLLAQTLADRLALDIGRELPAALRSYLLGRPNDARNERLVLACKLSLIDAHDPSKESSWPVAAVDITSCVAPQPSPVHINNDNITLAYPSPTPSHLSETQHAAACHADSGLILPSPNRGNSNETRKRRRLSATRASRQTTDQSPLRQALDKTSAAERPYETTVETQHGLPSPSKAALDKLIIGIWQALFSDAGLDSSELSQAGQRIGELEDLKLLKNTQGRELNAPCDTVFATRDTFNRVNLIARRISQTSRACRAIEICVQARWIECFDDRVRALSLTQSHEAARKCALSEACLDFGYSSKELRNKMCIWRGYQEVALHGGYVALVFSGFGLYRFCKYRLAFDRAALEKLETLRPAFEVAADTMHGNWRQVLGFIGLEQDPKYTGHLHDWVISGSHELPMPLAQTYHRWDKNFKYDHIHDCVVDVDAWGDCDPRDTHSASSHDMDICRVCGERQADNALQNECMCFPNIYGKSYSKPPPVQVGRTRNGKNNGLFACLPFAQGEAIGEFVGQITSGVEGLDVMFGQTKQTSYQIWQGKCGNYTRFVNHSCKPNAQYEHFLWLGKQRIMLVSQGIEAGAEITVDYSDVYWQVSVIDYEKTSLY